MTTKKLEGKEPKVEGIESTPKQEGADSTQPKGETTVDITKTDEFRRELDKALGKALESTNRQLSLRKKETDDAKSETEELRSTTTAQLDELHAELEDRIRAHDEALEAVDDDTIRKSYTDRISLSKKEREADRREKTAEERLKKAEKLVYDTGLEKLADGKMKDLRKEGYDVSEELLKEIEGCENEYEIEIATLKYRISNVPAEKKEPQEKEDKFDSGIGSGGKPTLGSLSPKEILKEIDKKIRNQ